MDAFLDLTKDIWDFLKVRKKYWLAPLIVTTAFKTPMIMATANTIVINILRMLPLRVLMPIMHRKETRSPSHAPWGHDSNNTPRGWM